MITQCLNKMCS